MTSKGAAKKQKHDFPLISPQIGATPGGISPVSANLAQMSPELPSEFVLPFDRISAPIPGAEAPACFLFSPVGSCLLVLLRQAAVS